MSLCRNLWEGSAWALRKAPRPLQQPPQCRPARKNLHISVSGRARLRGEQGHTRRPQPAVPGQVPQQWLPNRAGKPVRVHQDHRWPELKHKSRHLTQGSGRANLEMAPGQPLQMSAQDRVGRCYQQTPRGRRDDPEIAAGLAGGRAPVESSRHGEPRAPHFITLRGAKPIHRTQAAPRAQLAAGEEELPAVDLRSARPLRRQQPFDVGRGNPVMSARRPDRWKLSGTDPLQHRVRRHGKQSRSLPGRQQAAARVCRRVPHRSCACPGDACRRQAQTGPAPLRARPAPRSRHSGGMAPCPIPVRVPSGFSEIPDKKSIKP